jgi:aromatic-L-amino-acid/L-tryptophan decarboxylase
MGLRKGDLVVDSTTRRFTERPSLPSVSFDWDVDQWRDIGRQLFDLAVTASTGWDDRPAAPVDAGFHGKFSEPLPDAPVAIEQIIERLATDVIPAAIYNGHPRFLAYITSSPVPISIAGNLIASAMNSNTGLHRTAGPATAIELQTIDWIKEMLGFPADAEGIFLSGGQMANVAAHAVLRDAMTPWNVRRYGVAGPEGHGQSLRIYASREIHYCHQQAAELLGLGRDAVRLVPVDDHYRMRIDSLQAMIAEDRQRGHLPIAIVGTAGTVGTGAVDPLPELARLARGEELWFHVDGAYGAFAVLAPSAEAELRYIAEADSIACDPHKWLYAPLDAGVTLIREPGLLERSYSFHASYLHAAEAEQQIDLLERSPENSRPSRAMKVWLALQAFGRSGYRDMVEYNIQTAEYMANLIRDTPGLSLAAPRGLSIVCWRVEPDGVPAGPQLDRLQHQVIGELERRGVAIVSNATLNDGCTAIRACIVNFRTTPGDVEMVVAASAGIGRELAANLTA